MNTMQVENTPASAGKIAYLDVLRSIAIYLVIMLHCISATIVNASLYGTRTWMVCNILNSFVRMGVPIFFMISGFLTLSDERTLHLKLFYKKRLSKILVPFLVWDVIYFLTNFLFYGGTLTFKQFISELFANGSKFHLWFVYQIIALYLLAPFLKRILDNCRRREQWVLLILILLQPTLMQFLNAIQNVVTISPFRALIEGYAGFFVYGYMLGTCQLSKKAKWGIYGLGVIGFLLNVVGGYCSSSTQGINMIFNAGYSLTHYLTAGALFVAVKSLFHESSERGWKRKVSVLARKVAKLSFGIYLIHVFVLGRVQIPLLRAAVSPACNIAVAFAATAVISTLVMAILSKIKGVRHLLM